MQARKGFFARLVALWRGIWGVKLSDAEARNAEAVYHRSIEERQLQYNKLKDAVGRLVYLRNRLEADLKQREDDLALVETTLTRAAADEKDQQALALIRKRRQLRAEIERLQTEHGRINTQVSGAKESLAEVKASMVRLKEERAEMLARKAHALARLEVAETLADATGDFSSTHQALEAVRESISRLEYRADVGFEAESVAELEELSMADLRRQAADSQDQLELEALKARLSLTAGRAPQAEQREPLKENVAEVAS